MPAPDRRTRAHRITVGVVSAQVLGPNPNRVGLLFSGVDTTRYSVGFGEAAVLDSGYTVPLGGHPFPLLERSFLGSDITQPLFVIGAGAGNAGILEISEE